MNLDQNKKDLKKAIEIMKKYNSINDTISRASHFANVAIDSLGIFDKSKYKESLIALISSSLRRFN